MTKTSVFGQPEKKESEKKPIQLVKALIDSELTDMNDDPSSFHVVMLLEKGYSKSETPDLMWAYWEDNNKGCLYLGHWNDGIV